MPCDPRLHGALNCGSVSCPDLLPEPFEGVRAHAPHAHMRTRAARAARAHAHIPPSDAPPGSYAWPTRRGQGIVTGFLVLAPPPAAADRRAA